MKRNRTFLKTAIALLALILCSVAEAQQRPGRNAIGQNGPKPGSAAPDFELKTVDGKTIKGSDLWKQKPAVIMTALAV